MRGPRHRRRLAGAAFAAALGLGACRPDQGIVPPGAHAVEDPALSEMSGLVASRAQPGVLWSVNDSGSFARLFRLGPQGQALGRVAIAGAWLEDVETLARWREGGTDWLLLGDVGDNRGRRDHVVVHALREPEAGEAEARIAWSLRFRYPDGPRDAEGIAIDPVSGDLLVISKRDRPARLYRVPLATRSQQGVATAEFVGTVADAALQAQVTGLDVDDAGERLVVLTYRGLHVWERAPGQAWADALMATARSAPLPPMRKAEAMALSADGRSVLVGSEHRPTPLWSHPVAARRPMAAAP